MKNFEFYAKCEVFEVLCEVIGTLINSYSLKVKQSGDESRHLDILMVKRDHHNEWRCTATNAAGNASKTFTINVLVRPSINISSASPPLQTVFPFRELRLRCPIDAGWPHARIEWFMGNSNREKALNNAIHAELRDNNQTLIVHHADRARDEGDYTCVARNSVGEARKSFIVRVLSGPAIDLGPSGLEREAIPILLDKNIVLPCRLSAPDEVLTPDAEFPDEGKVRIEWTHNGKNLTLPSAHQLHSSESHFIGVQVCFFYKTYFILVIDIYC